MAFKKTPFRKTFRRKAKPRKKKSKFDPMGIRSIRADYSTIIPTGTENIFASNQLSTVEDALTFQFIDVLNSSQYTMFDQFRINWVEVKFVPVMTNNVVAELGTGTVPVIGEATPNYALWVDRDDDASPTDYNALKVRQGATIRKMTQGATVKFRPTVLNTLFRTGVTSSYSVMKEPQWIDMANSDTPHYGLKIALQAGGLVDEAFMIKKQTRYSISFANRRT